MKSCSFEFYPCLGSNSLLIKAVIKTVALFKFFSPESSFNFDFILLRIFSLIFFKQFFRLSTFLHSLYLLSTEYSLIM